MNQKNPAGSLRAIALAQKRWGTFPAAMPKPHLYREGPVWVCDDVLMMSYSIGGTPAEAYANRRAP